jgi:tRNA(Ile)-lysidine synthase
MQPLDAGAFTRLMAPFEPFETSPVLAVAVSGGRDSLALALLSHGWAAERAGRVVGLIVDHGLRAESTVEAAATRDVLARHGIEGAILTWSGAKPRGGLQAAARLARYRLLRDECRRRGILHLLLAHHAEDQAETVAMRLARRSGPDGLAGMAALVDQPEVRLLRPLLGVSRARLTATLLARGVQWLDDPSNVDPRFERARLRASGTPALAHSGGGVERSVRDGKLARAAVALLAFDQAWAATCRQGCSAASSKRWVGGTIRRAGSVWSGRSGGFARPWSAESRARDRISRFPAASSCFVGCLTAAYCTGLSGPNMAGT